MKTFFNLIPVMTFFSYKGEKWLKCGKFSKEKAKKGNNAFNGKLEFREFQSTDYVEMLGKANQETLKGFLEVEIDTV